MNVNPITTISYTRFFFAHAEEKHGIGDERSEININNFFLRIKSEHNRGNNESNK